MGKQEPKAALMPTDADDTLRPGDIPSERPTEPALPSAQVRCYTCEGHRLVIAKLKLDAEGCVEHAEAKTCPTCGGTGMVSRAEWARLRLNRQYGRNE
jgi:hypothetical protein